MGDKRISFPAYLAHRTTLAAKGTVGGALNWGPIIGAGALGAVSAWQRWPMMFEDTYSGVVVSAIVYTLIAWCVVFVWRFLFVVPYQMHVESEDNAAELGRRIELLESASLPKLRFSDDGALQEHGSLDDCRMYRIGVHNPSLSEAVYHVEARIASFKVIATDADTMLDRVLKDDIDEFEWTVKPKATKYAFAVATRPHKNPPRLILGPYPPGFSPISVFPGSYEICLEVSCSSAPPLKGVFTATLGNDGVLKWTAKSIS